MLLEWPSEYSPWVTRAWKPSVLGVSGRAESHSPSREQLILSEEKPAAALIASSALLRSRLKALIHRLRVLRAHSHLLVLLAQLLLYEGNRVIPRRQSLDFILAALVSNCVERALHHVDVYLHPRVLIALYGEHDFFTREILFQRSRSRRLRLIPFAVILRSGMNVVRRLIVVLDLHRLARHHAQHVRMILAAALVQDDLILRHIEGAIAQPIFHIDKNVGEVAVVDSDCLGFVHAFAGRILAHVDMCELWRRTVKLYRPVHCCHSGGINRRCRRSGHRRFSRVVGRLLRVLLLVARRSKQQATKCQRTN